MVSIKRCMAPAFYCLLTFISGSQDLYPTYLQDSKGFTSAHATKATIIGNCGAIGACSLKSECRKELTLSWRDDLWLRLAIHGSETGNSSLSMLHCMLDPPLDPPSLVWRSFSWSILCPIWCTRCVIPCRNWCRITHSNRRVGCGTHLSGRDCSSCFPSYFRWIGLSTRVSLSSTTIHTHYEKHT